MRLYTNELVKKYKSRTVVNHVSIDVRQGEIVGLLGPNGAGKTTTFYMIVGLIKPNEGRIFLENDEGEVSELTDLPVYRRAQLGVGYLAQEASVFRRLTVEENIRSVLEMTEFSKEYQAERVEALIEEFRLQKVRKSYGIQLSGGERRRTEIARAVAINPAFIPVGRTVRRCRPHRRRRHPVHRGDTQTQEHRRHHHRPQRRRDARHHRPHLSALRGQDPENRLGRGTRRRPDGTQGLLGPALRAEKATKSRRR